MSRFNVLLCLLGGWLISGCAALREPSELAWQTMHTIDAVQTFHLSNDPRYKEVESAWLLGEKPDQKAVFAWTVGSSLIHASVTQFLLDNDHPKLSKIWQYMTLSSICSTVGHNAQLGIRIGGPNAAPDPREDDISTWRWGYLR